MKTIGLIGGMSWESTAEYYRIINEETSSRLGGLHSARCIVYSVDFAEIERRQRENRWEEAAQILTQAAEALERAGADFLLICTNTMHRVFDAVRSGVHIPLLHIVDAVEDELKQAGIGTVGLLGTSYTMEGDFFSGRLERNGITVLVPDRKEREFVNDVIFDELCIGRRNPESKAAFLEIIAELAHRGAQGVILGCTEIGMLVTGDDSKIALFDTTRIHALKAVEYALQKPSASTLPARLLRVIRRFGKNLRKAGRKIGIGRIRFQA